VVSATASNTSSKMSTRNILNPLRLMWLGENTY
jgi:hypothetical protein